MCAIEFKFLVKILFSLFSFSLLYNGYEIKSHLNTFHLILKTAQTTVTHVKFYNPQVNINVFGFFCKKITINIEL